MPVWIDWEEHRADQRARRIKRIKDRNQEIKSLAKKGYKIEKIDYCHYRINGYMDVFLVHNDYHNLNTGKRGKYKSLTGFVLDKMETPLDKR